MPEPIETFYPESIAEWRAWLQENHLSKQAVWLVCYRIKSGKKSIRWSESVDVALCFGWIDSKKVKIDDERSHQFFSKRRPKSNWSKINKDKVEQLIAQGLMSEAGFASIETAKQNGSWTILDEVEAVVVPDDLIAKLDQKPAAKVYFDGLSKSAKKSILYWLMSAKRPETRQKRLLEVVERAEQGLKPKHIP